MKKKQPQNNTKTRGACRIQSENENGRMKKKSVKNLNGREIIGDIRFVCAEELIRTKYIRIIVMLYPFKI